MVKALGWTLLVISLSSLCVFLYATIVVHLLPEPSHPLLRLLREDQFYSLAVPTTFSVAVAVVCLNWFAISLYKSV
ncbi:phosphatidylinositol N-acetylglucosaminyltransferase subunit Y [Baffinella frigidus]|nr:phosphatidylinositol N-acetylglucosaminyltransferase subunit Y [Cryptophyta sp. CCMP2293]